MSYRTKACPICGVVKRMSGETCGLACRTKSIKRRYGKDFYAKAAKHAGQQASAQRAIERRERWAARFPGVPYDVCLTIRREGYGAGYNRCFQAQERHFERMRAAEFDKGYRAALQAARGRVA